MSDRLICKQVGLLALGVLVLLAPRPDHASA